MQLDIETEASTDRPLHEHEAQITTTQPLRLLDERQVAALPGPVPSRRILRIRDFVTAYVNACCVGRAQ